MHHGGSRREPGIRRTERGRASPRRASLRIGGQGTGTPGWPRRRPLLWRQPSGARRNGRSTRRIRRPAATPDEGGAVPRATGKAFEEHERSGGREEPVDEGDSHTRSRSEPRRRSPDRRRRNAAAQPGPRSRRGPGSRSRSCAGRGGRRTFDRPERGRVLRLPHARREDEGLAQGGGGRPVRIPGGRHGGDGDRGVQYRFGSSSGRTPDANVVST